MQNYITAVKAEHLKKKGTGIYVLSIILGAISPLIWGLVSIFNDNEAKAGGFPFNYYLKFIESVVDAFAGFFFPLLIIITVSRITQLDHKNGGWQLMETQPLRKISIYFSKFSVILIANLIAIVSLVAMSYLCAWLLSFIIEMPKHATTEFLIGDILQIMARLFLAGMLLTALQYVISVLMPSFIWSILIGFFLLLAYIFLKALDVTPDWYPIETLYKVSTYKKGSELGYWITYSETASLLLSIVLLYIGFKWYKHKKITRAFFGNTMRIVKLVGVLVVFGGLAAYVLMPKTMTSHNKTVIAGTIDSENQYSQLYLLDNFISDTVAVIPVTKNKFSFSLDKDIPLENYTLLFDNSLRRMIVLGKNDSIYIDAKIHNGQGEATVTGSRLAENQYAADPMNSWSYVEYELQENLNIDRPTVFTKGLVNEWKDNIQTSNKFKTVDNYVPREDFLKKNKTLLTIKYLNFWNAFLKKRNALYPDEKTEETADIKEMKKMVPLNDESLLSSADYFNYVRTQMINENKEDIDENTKALVAISKLSAGSFKDKMLYWQMDKSLREASTVNERTELIATYGYTFKDKKYSNTLLGINSILENLTKGKPAPLFDAMSIANASVNLANLRGKYVVIDVWATWCRPCREQSPNFEKFALKYKDQPIQFVALSTDKRIDGWYVEAKTKSKSVLQLHANDIDKFHKDYDVESIPRFILIDPQGNLVNSRMPFPSDQTFEQLLRDALGLAEEK